MGEPQESQEPRRRPWPKDLFYDQAMEFGQAILDRMRDPRAAAELRLLAQVQHATSPDEEVGIALALTRAKVYVLTREALDLVFDTAGRALAASSRITLPEPPKETIWAEFENLGIGNDAMRALLIQSVDPKLGAPLVVSDLPEGETIAPSPPGRCASRSLGHASITSGSRRRWDRGAKAWVGASCRLESATPSGVARVPSQ